MINKPYTAITLDTSIFDGNRLLLEKGLLGKLSQFKNSKVKFVLTDIVVHELKKHLNEKIKASKNSLEKSIEDAREHLFFEGSDLNEAKEKILKGKNTEDLAKSRVENFIESTGAQLLDSGSYVSVSELRDKYFNNEAPFATTGKKKNEFPDAIALMALESWAEANDERIYAVAKDKDWELYCQELECIDYFEDLSKALDHFNRHNTPSDVITRLESAISNNTAMKFTHELSKGLEDFYSGIVIDQDCDSPLNWEPQGVNISLADFHFSEDELQIVNSEHDSIIVEAYLNVDLDMEGEFSLYQYDSIDRDNIYMGSVSPTVSQNFEEKVLITVSGDLEKAKADPDELEIVDVEVLKKNRTVHFGYLEPEIEPDYD